MPTYVELVSHVLQYVSETLELGLKFDGEAKTQDNIIGYTDSDFAGSKLDPKSTECCIFMLAVAAISHLSKLQSIATLSNHYAEYVAIFEAGKETVWVRYLLADLGFRKRSTPVTLYDDNQGSIALLNNPEFHSPTKQIDVRFHFIRAVLSMKQLNIVYIPTAEMAADGLTKSWSASGFLEFRRTIGINTGL